MTLQLPSDIDVPLAPSGWTRLPRSVLSDCATALRVLVTDITEGERGGHPGMALGFADVAVVLALNFLQFDGSRPGHLHRDRLVLSAGHGSALLYAMLHMMGVAAFDTHALRRFRHHDTRASSHPEFDREAGIDATTGPLGQGIANAVGLAIEGKRYFAQGGIKREPHVYVIAGDGCIMEGICHEACSLAGHLALDNLTLLYDANRITCDGDLSVVQSEDVAARFAAYGWDVQSIDGHDIEAIQRSLSLGSRRRPRFILCNTVIGRGAPTKQGGKECHGAPLGRAEADALRSSFGWKAGPFEVPEAIARIWRQRNQAAARDMDRWADVEDASSVASLDLQDTIRGLDQELWAAIGDRQNCSTRELNGLAMAALRAPLDLVGGSADLDESTHVQSDPTSSFTSENRRGRHIHFGIREHAMAAIANGIASFGTAVRPFCATYLVFSDYMRPALRLACMMRLGTIFVFTHDSILASDDGITHQPVEHIPSLAGMPRMHVARPAGPDEVAAAWIAIERSGRNPTALLLSRQPIPFLLPRVDAARLAEEGAWVCLETLGQPQITICSWGADVLISMAAAKLLIARELAVRVVSVPMPYLTRRLPKERAEEIFVPGSFHVTVFAHSDMDWSDVVGAPIDCRCFVSDYGVGGSAAEAAAHAGLTAEALAERIASSFMGAR